MILINIINHLTEGLEAGFLADILDAFNDFLEGELLNYDFD